MSNISEKNRKPESSFIEDVTFKYLPYWPLLIALGLLFGAMGWLYLKFTPHVYEITSSLLVTDDKKGADENPTNEQLNLPSSKKIVENEIEVIKSQKLMDEVIKELHLYAPTYQHGRFTSGSAYTSSPIVVEVNNPDSLQTQEKVVKIYYSYNSENSTVSINGKDYPINQFVQTPYGELKFLTNKNFIKPTTLPLYFVLKNVGEVTTYMEKQLDVSEVGKLSSIVKLTMKDDNPRRGEDILNSLMDKYNKSSIDYKNQLAKNTIGFIDERLAAVSNQLKVLGTQIKQYRTAKGAVDLTDQSRLYLQNVTQNDQKLADVNTQLAVLDQVQKYVTTKDNSAGIVPSTLGVSDPLLTKLVDQLYEAQIQYDKLKKTTGENNPVLQALSRQIENIRPSITENIQNQKATLEAGRNNITSTNTGYNSMLSTIPEKERGLIDVSRQDAIENATYAFLLQKREQTALTYASNLPDSKIIDPARSSVIPVGPKRSVTYLIALGAAILLTFAFIGYKELFTQKILFRKDIENYTDVPIVGEITNLKKKESTLLKSDNLLLTEQLRQLRVATGLFSEQLKYKKILVTSSIAGEGKSMISSNLGISISKSGKKVLLLDADIRNPQFSKLYKLENTLGITDYLHDNIDPKDLVNDTEYSNLYVIAAGKTGLTTTEFLLNGKIRELFHYLESSFDVIIIDSSPVSLVADAYVWSEFSDLTLYVIRHGYTDKTFVKNLDYNNRARPLTNMAIIFNGIKKRGFLKNDYGYGYGYETVPVKKASYSPAATSL